MLCLANQVDSNIGSNRSVISENCNLSRSSFRVDPDNSPKCTLGGSNIDIARSGYQVALFAEVFHAVGKECNSLRSSNCIDLCNSQKGARCQNSWVRQSGKLTLRRRSNCDAAHLRNLRRNHIHHHATWINGATTRDIETNAIYRHPTLCNSSTINDLGGGFITALVFMHLTNSCRRLF